MNLYLVRHGESAFNAEGRIQGQLNPPLSPLGLRQSTALVRAMQTAAPVAAALGLAPRTDDRLLELNAGVFQGLTWPEINQRIPAEGDAWKSQNPDFRIPGGESRRDLMVRGQAALAAIREAGHNQVIVVAHGGVLTAALKALLGVPAERNPFVLYNGSISMVEWNSQFRLMTLNQMEHLHASGDDLRTRTGDL
jgi:probable phosphoglycerate mutase